MIEPHQPSGSSPIEESSNLILLKRVVKLGNFSLNKKSMRKHILFARLKVNSFLMLLGSMLSNSSLKSSMKRQLCIFQKLKGLLRKSFLNFYMKIQIMQETVLKFTWKLALINFNHQKRVKDVFLFLGLLNS